MSDNTETYRILFNDGFTAGIKQAQAATEAFEGAVGELKSMIASAFGVYAVVEFAKGVVDATATMEGFKNQLNFASGSAQQGAKDLQFITDEAEKLGLSLEPTIQAFASLEGATRGTSLAGQATKDIFMGVSEAATAMHLSSDQASGALLALQQMASKGTVQAEELRGQLGERIPGAFHLAAEAMGVTEAKLNDMLKKGEVVASDFLPKFAKSLHENFGDAAMIASDSLVAEMNRASTSIFQLQTELGEYLYPVIADVFGLFRDSITFIREHGSLFKALAVAVGIATVAYIGFGLAAKLQAWYTGLSTAAIIVNTLVTEGLTAAMLALNIAFYANPIVWIIGIIVLLAGAVVYCYNEFETFREIVDEIGSVFVDIFSEMWAWASRIVEIIVDIVTEIYTIMDALGMFEPIKDLFEAIGDVISWIGEKITWIWENVLKPILVGIRDAYRAIKDMLGIKEELEVQAKITTNPTDMMKEIQKGIPANLSAGLVDVTKGGKATETKSVVGSRSNVITINIGKLIEDFSISTTNMKESATAIKEQVAKALLEAVNDANLIGNV